MHGHVARFLSINLQIVLAAYDPTMGNECVERKPKECPLVPHLLFLQPLNPCGTLSQAMIGGNTYHYTTNESSNLDHFNDPSPSRPPPEPPDVEICFDFKPDTGVVTNKVVGDISEHDVLMPNLLPTQPTLCPVFDLLLSFLSENEDKVFNPGILISPLLSHRGEIISNFSKSPMMISGGDIPYLDVPYLHFYPPLTQLKYEGSSRA
ncbi:hypothetical protein Tco_1501273 [Tanacetum coccineum]